MIHFNHKVIREIELRSCCNSSGSVNNIVRRIRGGGEIELFRNSFYCQKTERYLIRCFFIFHIYTIQDALNLILLNMLEYFNMIMIIFYQKLSPKFFIRSLTSSSGDCIFVLDLCSSL